MSMQNSPLSVGKMSLLNSLCRLRPGNNKVFVVIVHSVCRCGALPVTTLRSTQLKYNNRATVTKLVVLIEQYDECKIKRGDRWTCLGPHRLLTCSNTHVRPDQL